MKRPAISLAAGVGITLALSLIALPGTAFACQPKGKVHIVSESKTRPDLKDKDAYKLRGGKVCIATGSGTYVEVARSKVTLVPKDAPGVVCPQDGTQPGTYTTGAASGAGTGCP